MQYRALTNLRKAGQVIRTGALVSGAAFSPDLLARLVMQGRLSPVQGPPLAALPQFAPYAEALAEAGAQTVADVLDLTIADVSDLADDAGGEFFPLVELQHLATELLAPPPCVRCGGY